MHPFNHLKARQEIVLFDTANPRSIVNIVPEALAVRIRVAWASAEKPLFGMSERKLRGELQRRGKSPTPTDERIRLQFWLEYERMQSEDERTPKFNIEYVIGFAMSKETFYQQYIIDNCALAWMLCPVVSYQSRLEEALTVTIEKVVAVVDQIDPSKLRRGDMSFLLKVGADFTRQLYGSGAGRPRKEETHEVPDTDLEVPVVMNMPPMMTSEEAIALKKKALEEMKKELPTQQLPVTEIKIDE
jgi:hypothetical protein